MNEISKEQEHKRKNERAREQEIKRAREQETSKPREPGKKRISVQEIERDKESKRVR